MLQPIGDKQTVVNVAEIRDHVRVDDGCDDLMLKSYINAAVDYCEGHTRRIIGRQQFRATFPGFKCIELPHPLTTLDSFRYYDKSGAQQDVPVSTYHLDRSTVPASLVLADGKSWPETATRPDAVSVEVTAGDVPDSIRQAIYLLVGHWYANREAVNVGQPAHEVPLAVESLLYPHRIYNL